MTLASNVFVLLSSSAYEDKGLARGIDVPMVMGRVTLAHVTVM
jgi:hypothetical protein